jgi:hypothetical protein
MHYSGVMRIRSLLLLLLAVLPLMLAPGLGSAQTFPAFTQTDTYSNVGWGVSATRGWSFTVGSGIVVQQLGFWDSAKDGLATPHAVGLWRGDGTLLSSAQVPAGTAATLDGTFRWACISYPLIKPGLMLVSLIIGLFSWPYISRIIRGQVLSLREKEFVEASRSLGASNWRIMAREILPNVAAPLIVYTTLIIPSNILFEAGLSFLGVGVPDTTPSWGAMLSQSASAFRSEARSPPQAPASAPMTDVSERPLPELRGRIALLRPILVQPRQRSLASASARCAH